MIRTVKNIRKEPVAVLTNSSLMHREDVKKDLFAADFVVAKLDAPLERIFRSINRPGKGLNLSKTIKAIKDFKARYKGRLALQIMFMKENEKFAGKIAQIARDIGPDEVQINTPLRPCGVKPLSKKRMEKIQEHFRGLNVVSVYKARKIKVKPVSRKDTLRRRGKV
jgi:wyosine [tRNA(Phe)-imidazoG37] synthetase (radical SAM superfamily)